MNYERTLMDMVNACVEAGKKLAQLNAMAGAIQPLYLHYKKSTEKSHGELLLIAATDPVPEGYERACEDDLHGGVPYENYFCWVRSRSMRLPILALAALA